MENQEKKQSETGSNSSIPPEKNVKAFIFDSAHKSLKVLDQLSLPKTIRYVDVLDTVIGYDVIKKMLVRGAPCIAAVGCLSVIVELNQKAISDSILFHDPGYVVKYLEQIRCYLLESRPTAVNLKHSLDKMVLLANNAVNSTQTTGADLIELLTKSCIQALEVGLLQNELLGDFGAEELIHQMIGDRCSSAKRLVVLTHCNTGSLATVGYGTALGIIRSLHKNNKLDMVYCTETRPYNQGSRLTAWELVREHLPATLIADSMVAYLMETKKIDAVVVGADRVAANGDTVNKVGTLQIAVLANHYKVPFYVAAPTQSIDISTPNLDSINIEQRPANEMRNIAGVTIAPEEVNVWNPSFDATPARLITSIITEIGVFKTCDIKVLMEKKKKSVQTDDMVKIEF